MKSTDIEFITAAAGLVGETIRKGFDFPVYLVAVGSNGSVVVERVEGAGEQWTLTEHYEGDTSALLANKRVNQRGIATPRSRAGLSRPLERFECGETSSPS